jgi:hypothetical protein
MQVGTLRRDAYLTALLDGDLPAARQVLDDALEAGVPVREVYLEVLQPVPCTPRTPATTSP